MNHQVEVWKIEDLVCIKVVNHHFNSAMTKLYRPLSRESNIVLDIIKLLSVLAISLAVHLILSNHRSFY